MWWGKKQRFEQGNEADNEADNREERNESQSTDGMVPVCTGLEETRTKKVERTETRDR